VRAGAAAGDSLYVADADGTNERQIVAIRGGMHLHWPQWSADGQYVYFIYSPATSNSEPAEIYRVRAGGGPTEPIVRTARRAIFPAPTADGRGLLFTWNPRTAEAGVWWKSLSAQSPPRSVTSGLGEYADLSVSRQTGNVVASAVEVHQTLMALAVGSASNEPRSLTSGFTGDLDPTISPKTNRLVFSSLRDGTRTLWSADVNGDNTRPLTSGTAFDERPAVSPDGERIAFVSDRGGERGIWIMNADGGAARLLAHGAVLDTISWSPDSRELVYATPVDDAPGLWVVNADTGAVRRLVTPGPATFPAWCPRGDLIAYVEAQRPEEGRPNSSQIAFVNRLGERVNRGLTDSRNVSNGFLAWAPDGRRLAAFIEPGSASGAIWILDGTGADAPVRAATLPPGVRLRGATWASDGSSIVFGHIQRASDIVLFER
jgi:Tol biopolymer transport system component